MRRIGMADVLKRFSPDDDGPAIAVTWYEAAMYCNWLSEKEGLPRSERVYPSGHMQDRVERFQTAAVDRDDEDSELQVLDRDARTRRGGAFPYGAAFARSAARGTVTSLPTNRRDNVGFRIARTVT